MSGAMPHSRIGVRLQEVGDGDLKRGRVFTITAPVQILVIAFVGGFRLWQDARTRLSEAAKR
jgi:hypothetical protein